MKFLYSSGLRIGETCGLTSEHVDFKNGEGFITRDITKSDAGVREFCFDIELSERLKDQIKNNKCFPFTPRTYQRDVEAISNANVINKKFTPHSFKHSCVTNLMMSGVPLSIISKYAGHKDI